MKGESARTRRLCKDVQRAGWLYFPIVASRFQPAGWPDRFFVLPDGVVLFCEFKEERGRVRPDQKVVLARLRKCGANAVVVRWEREEWIFEDEEGEELARGPGNARGFLTAALDVINRPKTCTA